MYATTLESVLVYNWQRHYSIRFYVCTRSIRNRIQCIHHSCGEWLLTQVQGARRNRNAENEFLSSSSAAAAVSDAIRLDEC